MKIEFSKSSQKVLEKLSFEDRKQVFKKLKILKDHISISNRIPYEVLDIKGLHGQWEPLLRLRVGKLKLIFEVDSFSKTIKVHKLDHRGKVY
jgi:mRNA-degrading endonuclease RelE of RelBE toxin-antitoxin system